MGRTSGITTSRNTRVPDAPRAAAAAMRRRSMREMLACSSITFTAQKKSPCITTMPSQP